MSPTGITESVVEEAALNWLEAMRYGIQFGPDIAPGELHAERTSYEEVVLAGRLRDAIDRLNPNILEEAREEAFRKVTILNEPSLVRNNRAFHKFLTDGVPVEYQGDEAG
jgi:type I restriction enzyme R subunit